MGNGYILLTGASGFVGYHLARWLLSRKKYNVVAIVRPKNKEKIDALRRLGAIVWEGNFYEPTLVAEIFAQFPISRVVHLAAVRGAGSTKAEDYLQVNVAGTQILLAAALKHKVKRFVFCSSVGVYGVIPSEVPAGLSTRLNGDTIYHKSKVLAEEKVQEFIGKGLDACIVRPTIMYGRDDNGFPVSLTRLVKKRLLPLSWRANRIHLLSVDSVNELIEALLSAAIGKEKIFIAADTAPILFEELVDKIHQYYYGRKYPPYLKLPNIFFSGLHLLFRLVKNEKWAARTQLISRDWFYDTEVTTSLLGINQRNTKKEFLKMLSKSDDL